LTLVSTFQRAAVLLQGKSGIVTGAARGMGRAASELFARAGAQLVCADIDLNGAQAVAASLGSHAIGIKLDLSSRGDCVATVNASTDKFGSLDFLVNFGGIWDGRNTAEIGDEHWDLIMDVNLKGTFLICQAASAVMMKQKQGRIVLIGSIAARVGGEMGGPHYAASKGGVISLSRALARRLGPSNVTVNTINPGPVESDMTASWSAEAKQRLAQVTPLGRIGQPIDIARVALFLVSDLSGWMTGQTLEVNGGAYFG
jgi:NAD(P)-dependent dehydrogenase (short-subunit alcohol dehydrogenase family)